MQWGHFDALRTEGMGHINHRLISDTMVVLIGRLAVLAVDVFHHLHVYLVGDCLVQQELGVECAVFVRTRTDQRRGQLVAGERCGGQLDTGSGSDL